MVAVSQNWNPIHDLLNLQDRMNRLFEDATKRHAGGDHVEDSQEPVRHEQDIERTEWSPAADVFERENEYVIALDLPGIDRQSLDISLDKDRLVIRGNRKTEGESRRRAERPHGRFFRKFKLPSTVDEASISAEYKDGELRVTLPKRTEQQTRRVEIKVS
jgi:HSP20 family protein